ncbi:hypothetical protein D9M68_963320 [compost metagenome]
MTQFQGCQPPRVAVQSVKYVPDQIPFPGVDHFDGDLVVPEAMLQLNFIGDVAPGLAIEPHVTIVSRHPDLVTSKP